MPSMVEVKYCKCSRYVEARTTIKLSPQKTPFNVDVYVEGSIGVSLVQLSKRPIRLSRSGCFLASTILLQIVDRHA